MALLKVFKGLEANLPNNIIEGQLYFTTDSCKLLLDADNEHRIQVGGNNDSPEFTGVPTAPTASPGTNTNQIATTAFVKEAVDSKTIEVDDALSSTSENPVQNKVIKAKIDSIDSDISTINTSLDNKVDKISGKGLSTNDFTTTLKNKLDGIAEGATAISVDTSLSSTSINPLQNKAINTALGLKANLASPNFSGTPTAPTAADNTNTTQIATTAFVQKAVSTKADSDHTHRTSITTGTSTSSITLVASTKYSINAGGTSYVFTTPPDTKNTAGSTNNGSKLFLIGATSQGANPQTYSNSNIYAQAGTLTATSASFSSPITVGTPTATTHATTKAYVDEIGYTIVSALPTSSISSKKIYILKSTVNGYTEYVPYIRDGSSWVPISATW